MLNVNFPSILNLFSLTKYMKLTNDGNENNILLLPYKLARKVLGTKSYLVFYVWNEVTQKLQRIRREPPVSEKQSIWFKERSRTINEMLINGCRIVSDVKLKNVENTPQQYTIIQAFNEITNIRIANKVVGDMAQKRQKSFLTLFEKYLVLKKLDKLLISELQKIHVITYIDTLAGQNSTKNSYLKYLNAMLNQMLQRDWILKNPANGIKMLKEQESTSIAFASKDLPQLKNLLIEHSSELYIFCMFIFYTFIRPIELRRLTVGSVDLVKKRILIEGSQSKNKKSQYVLISKQFLEILEKYEFLKDRDLNEPLFKDKNNKNYSKNQFSVSFSKIIQQNDFPKKYAIYGWKHTGVSEHYKITKDIKFIQMQCRHSSLDETNKYLKGLGLFEHNENLDNAPTI